MPDFAAGLLDCPAGRMSGIFGVLFNASVVLLGHDAQREEKRAHHCPDKFELHYFHLQSLLLGFRLRVMCCHPDSRQGPGISALARYPLRELESELICR